MQKTGLAIAFILLNFFGYSQKELFHTDQKFSEEHLKSFYSSVTIDSSMVLFIANDYTLYAYDRQSGQQKWSTLLNHKTSVAPYIKDNIIYTTIYKDKATSAAMFNALDGKLLKELPVEMLQTKPFIRDGILYGTAIYDGGCLFAYDTKKDTILWWRFLAHGVSTQPYFYKDHILANAESDNWVKINYQGGLVDTTCKVKAHIFVRDIPCIRNFSALTHDGEEINGKLAENLFGEDHASFQEILTTKKNSFVLHENTITIIGNKRKIKQKIDINFLTDTVPDFNYEKGQLLQVDDERITFFYNNHIYIHNYDKKKLEKLIDLSSWRPYQVLLDNDHAWVISRNDGRLYRLQL
jgi:hypothetical protein